MVVGPQQTVMRFVRQVRLAAWSRAALAALAFALALLLGWLSLRPRFDASVVRPVSVALVLLASGVLLRELWRAWLPIAALDAELGLRDALRTFWPQRRADRDGMAAWLARDLAVRLPRAAAKAVLARRTSRALRRLVYLLAILALVWVLLWLSPLGLRGGEGHGVGGEPQATQGRDAPASAGGANPQPQARLEPQPQQPPPGETPSADDADAPVAPLPLPVREEFVMPSYVGDGSSRVAKARVGEQEETRSQPPPPAPGAANQDTPPPPTPAEFARAAEAAVQARHVPDAERPFVQRYFKALVERR